MNQLNKGTSIIETVFLTAMLVIAALILIGPEIKMVVEYLPHIMIGLLLSGLILLILNEEKMMITSMALCGMICVLLKNESNSDLVNPQPSDDPSISIANYNLANTHNVYELSNVIQSRNDDVILFQEYTPDWATVLIDVVGQTYIYEAQVLRGDHYGKIIFSKLPITDVDTISDGNNADLSIQIETKGNSYRLYSSYITPALDELSGNLADQQLDLLANSISSQKIPVITAGEFNMVYWSESVSDFRDRTKLKNSRKHVSPASFKSSYDHIFYSSQLDCINQGNIIDHQNSKLGYYGEYQIKSQQSLSFDQKQEVDVSNKTF